MKRVSILLVLILTLSACQQRHLDIFPELSNEALLTKQLTVEQMHDDIDAFLEGALTRHPEIEEYADVPSLKAQAEKLKASITSPLTRIAFYRVVGKLSPFFQDGHSFLIWPYQELNLARDQGHKTFPLSVTVGQNGQLQLKQAYKIGDRSIPSSTEILSINGVESDQILSTLKQYVGGETELLREHVVAMRFGIGLWAYYGWLDSFNIELELPDGAQSVSLQKDGLWPEADAQATGMTASEAGKDHYYKRLSEDVGFIYLAHFDVEPDTFETFIDDTFATLREQKIKHLIIDVRDNPGGNTDTVTYLTKHLADKPFRMISKLKEKLNEENRGWFNYKGEVGEILLSDWDDWETPVAENKRFHGSTYLLIGPVTYSASIVLATTLKDNDIATLVGKTTGGFANQSAQGNLFNLPHSELRAYITTRMLVRPNGELARQGVVPHYNVNDYAIARCQQADGNNDPSLALIDLLLSGELEECKKVVTQSGKQ
ncbi:peptidase S41 [Alteromonas sediminis]|uniref:Peptidase S41 n=1 Tax=Alteromonas sediminis TaxID=2259342 RepID=A0A3N5Z882_9ALTE|nr:S41 family peptidase [Alteromonas sediminis]RPJ66984.1 peptidase S41 [Alteromonas sediminis]